MRLGSGGRPGKTRRHSHLPAGPGIGCNRPRPRGPPKGCPCLEVFGVGFGSHVRVAVAQVPYRAVGVAVVDSRNKSTMYREPAPLTFESRELPQTALRQTDGREGRRLRRPEPIACASHQEALRHVEYGQQNRSRDGQGVGTSRVPRSYIQYAPSLRLRSCITGRTSTRKRNRRPRACTEAPRGSRYALYDALCNVYPLCLAVCLGVTSAFDPKTPVKVDAPCCCSICPCHIPCYCTTNQGHNP